MKVSKKNVLALGATGLMSVAALAPMTTLAQKPSHALAAKPGGSSIVQIVTAPDGEFDVLQAAVVRLGLVEELSGPRQYTVFAPTDAAFAAALGGSEASALNAVNTMNIDQLRNIVLYHVMPGRHTSNSVLARDNYRMLNGERLTKAELQLNTPDQSAKNGVIHIINNVLLP